ncbi:LOW QUALITY PROTEIN: nucleoporin SONB [Purpureocillium lavendulum]|uniref:Nucleoporin SONB n=1 Tax=Purpureocillium lavendulum TaxID=1247861 RepID=A0AB34FRJ9_9HYPO|nr:LOW QUALITY PROTEIN: nucleoporin SONB [Purpureocillium lavendulum]
MSGSGFGGFGSNTNQTTGGFGGFGGANNPSSGFGQTANTGGSMFGGGGTTNAGGFGAATGKARRHSSKPSTVNVLSGGGFGANTGGGFGNKPAFGGASTTSGGMFGASANTGTSTFGGFGGGNTATASSPFGGGNTATGGLFGNNAQKTGFGTTGTTGSSLFGGGNTSTGTGFGASGGFGATNNPSIGGGVGDPPGTASTPFQAFTEKETTNNQTNSFQNILFQEPYKKWSAEELRLTDYVQGRRHGNASGAGAFGVGSNFGGGFGTTNQTAGGFGANTGNAAGGLFGATSTNANTANTGGAFGQTGAGGFGATANQATGGGLFGGSKPSGGLFGGAQTQQQQSGGSSLFGSNPAGGFGTTANATPTGFGANANTGGGLFGSNAQANKPQGTGFSFGNANTGATNTGGFGNTGSGFGASNTNTGGGGLFGNTGNQASGGGLFGNTQQQQQQSTGSAFGTGFGTQNQNQQGGGGLFGGNQQKPATGGLFGSSTTNTAGGGLFGNASNQQQQNATGFGQNTNAAAGGGLFGAAKPSTGGGLFGGSTATQANPAGGTGLFGGLGGGAQNQQSSGSSLFGGAASATQQKPGGLFGSATQSTGSGLFGGQGTPSQGSSLFGGANQQQAQGAGLGGSLLGSSQQANNAPQGLTANLNDVSAYGSPSLFAGVGGNEVSNPGPLATPLNGNSKPRRSSILPMYKLAPAAASRFATPQKRGFGFSYSSYGTPGVSPASSISSTPGGLGRSLLSSSSVGSLSKSMSTNNLRRSFNTEDSILAPGAFSSSSSSRWYGSTGSKKLVINRDIRSDLFSTPQKDRPLIDGSTNSRKLSKRVSFDTTAVDGEDSTPVRGALPAPEPAADLPADETTPRQNRSSLGTNGSKTPEVEQVKGNELAIVHEEDNLTTSGTPSTVGFDNLPGDYWMTPSKDELLGMNRMQRQRIDDFTVGRENVGYISFKVPVDISGIEIEELCGNIIQLEPRSATVYPVQAKKPPVGKGLNVPAMIALEQSWPRGGRDKRVTSDPKRFSKHIERLKRIPDTVFESYDKETGVWIFSVEHFTTYGLDDSDEESDDDMGPPPASSSTPAHLQPISTDVSVNSAMDDDTFDFKQHRGVPGAFDQQADLYPDQDASKQSFLGVSSADSPANNVTLSLEEHDDNMDDGYDLSDDEDMTRSSLGQHQAAEQDDNSSENEAETKRGTPGGILRARMRAMKDSVGPVQLEVADGDDWMEMLRKTVSPVKRDRQLLRELNESPSKQPTHGAPFDGPEQDGRKSSIWGKSFGKAGKAGNLGASTQLAPDKGRGFATSIDLMNSLFEKPKPARQNLRASVSAKGFPQWPYDRQDKTLTVDEAEQAFHDASRPTWGPDETLVVTRLLSTAQPNRTSRTASDVLTLQRSGIQTGRQDLRLGRLSSESSKKFLRAQDQVTEIRVVDGVPAATLRAAHLQDLFHHQDMNDPVNIHEQRVWELAGILFDEDTGSVLAEPDHVQRKARLSKFWTDLVEPASSTNIGLAGTNEEKAVACLAGHRVTEACRHLVEGKNFRLGTLVPLIGTSASAKSDMKAQLRAWHESKMLSEFTEAVRAIYELLAGNVSVCDGMKDVPLEDRMDSFIISKKFGLDWRQAFGLRLWYATERTDSAAAAVKLFLDDIQQDREELPKPWYTEQGIVPVWDDAGSANRQDLLWGLLQLYADKDADLEAIIRPENSQLSPLDTRLCWQLGLALTSTGKVSYGLDSAAKADASTLSYAAQLTGAGDWLEAAFVMLHLSDPTARMKAIQEHLCRHAGLIGPETGPTFALLTEKFQIPAAWLWEALALYMRSVRKDASAEVHCLLQAGSFVEAHRVLVHQVAPRAIIERDYATLSALLSQFDGRHDLVTEWTQGGEIYSHFLKLVQHRGRGETAPATLLEKLLANLGAMNRGVGDTEVIRYAAVSDMADETAKEIFKQARKKQGQDAELRSQILALPLTQDRLLAYSVDLSMEVF